METTGAILLTMEAIEDVCCDSCINNIVCARSNPECITSFARIARNMLEKSEKLKVHEL